MDRDNGRTDNRKTIGGAKLYSNLSSAFRSCTITFTFVLFTIAGFKQL